MRSFHTPTQKIPPISKNSPTKIPIFHLSPQILNFPLFFNENRTSLKFTPYRTPYRQSPYLTTLFRPLSHKIQLKIFTNSLFHPNFLPYIKAFLRCTIFTSKKSPFNSFSNQKIFKHSTENNTCV